MFIKFKSLDVEKGRDITVTVDLSDIRECISYGAGYRGVVTTHWAEYTVTSDECERIEALLMGTSAPEPAALVARHVADTPSYRALEDAYKTADAAWNWQDVGLILFPHVAYFLTGQTPKMPLRDEGQYNRNRDALPADVIEAAKEWNEYSGSDRDKVWSLKNAVVKAVIAHMPDDLPMPEEDKTDE